MFFRDIVGQDGIKDYLRRLVQARELPHALLMNGDEGTGKLPMALALTRYALCDRPVADDACGVCPSCRKMDVLMHPDVHFTMPIVKKSSKEVTSDDYLAEWRDLLRTRHGYFAYSDWLNCMDAENKQAQIFVSESERVMHVLSRKSSEGKYKVWLVWHPEKMNKECANKILKLLEEPPALTLILLITDHKDEILPTVVSRARPLFFPRLSTDTVSKALSKHAGLEPAYARQVAAMAEGDYVQALKSLSPDEDSRTYFTYFKQLMRYAYARDVWQMKQWSEAVAGMGREKQKHFLAYCQHMIRENFILNFGRDELTNLSSGELQFSTNFYPFVHERNIVGISEELSEAEKHIGQNVNAKMVFFDMAIHIIALIKNK